MKNKVKNLKDYDVVFVGYPIWHGDLPMAVYTFFDENNLSEKTIVIFSTHEGSGLTGTDDNIANYTKGKVVKETLSIREKRVQDSKDKVETDIKK